jgi:Flp pilus assembly protein TadB
MEALPDRLPLVIGVTGHRDLRDDDLPRLEREVGDIITRLRRDFLRNDPETPIIVLSALAEGADRLVARVALARGARLIAPLPMPLEEYRHDFEPGLKEGNLVEFNALFAQAIAAPVMALDGNSLEQVRADQDKRNEQYRAVGIYIIQHCHVLLALWDGNAKDMSPGGTAEVVTFKRQGIPLSVSGSPHTSLDASEIGPVIEIVTPRTKEGNAVKEIIVRPWGRAVIKHYRGGFMRRGWHRVGAFLAHVLGREREDERYELPAAERRELENWENFESIVELTRHFNCDAAALLREAKGPDRLTRSLDNLFTDAAPAAAVDAAAKKHAVDVAPLWCHLHSIVDTLAQERQRQFKRDWKVLFFWAFVAFFFFAIFSHAATHVAPTIIAALLAAYSFSFLIIVIVFRRAVRGRHQERFLDYRALAEALRVAVYWKLLGIGSRYSDAKIGGAEQRGFDPLATIAQAYPIQQPTELAWVKICLRSLEPLDKAEGRERIDARGHEIAKCFWVRGQFEYFRRQGLRHNEWAEANETRAGVMAVLSAFVIVPVLIFLFLLDINFHWRGTSLQQAIIVVLGLLPGVAAALTGYTERLAYKAQARQYDRMRMLFERACELLPDEVDPESTLLAHGLYSRLGIEAMQENAEWVAIYRQRPIQPLQG